MNRNKIYLLASITIATLIIIGAFGASNYPAYFTLPVRWTTYQDKKMGIVFKYPSDLNPYFSGNDPNISLESLDHGKQISITRLFGFGAQDWVKDVFISETYASTTATIQTFSVNRKIAVMEFWPDSPEEKTLYIPVDDAVFTIRFWNIDTKKFLRSLKFTKPQVLVNYKMFSGNGHKTFVNSKRGYSIDIPNSFGFVVEKVSGAFFQNDNAILFREPYDGPGSSIFVTVASSTKNSLTGVINTSREKFEKNITVDGMKAVITYSANSIEEFPDYKTVYILKNGLLYDINMQYIDYEKVLAGFKFLK